jgi:hypothetical protein
MGLVEWQEIHGGLQGTLFNVVLDVDIQKAASADLSAADVAFQAAALNSSIPIEFDALSAL